MRMSCWFVALLFSGTLVIRADAAPPAPNDLSHSSEQWYRIDSPVWRVAPRHKPFFSRPPRDFNVQQLNDSTKLQKLAGLGNWVYHVCPDVPLQVGQRIRVVYSLTKRGGAGGTPVPYFGVRNDQGLEHVLFLFGSSPKPEKVHEIVVQRHAGGFRAKRGQRVVDEQAVDRNFGTLTDPIFVFFHMNDVSEVVIHEVATSVPPEHTPVPMRLDVVQSSCGTRHCRGRSRCLINVLQKCRRR